MNHFSLSLLLLVLALCVYLDSASFDTTEMAMYTTDDSMEIESTYDSMDDTDVTDSPDTPGDGDDSSSSSSSSSSESVETPIDLDGDDSLDDEEVETFCKGRSSEDECYAPKDDDGDNWCGYNAESGCHSVVRREGMFGSGNFDNGYIAGQNSASAQTDELNTIIGVLAGIIAALVIVMGGGAYYLWKQIKLNNNESVHRAVEMMDNETADLNDHQMEIEADETR